MPSGSLPVLFTSPLDSFDALCEWADFHVVTQKKRGVTEGWFHGPVPAPAVEARPPADSAAAFLAHLALLRDGLTAMRERGDLHPEANPGDLAASLLAALLGGTRLCRVRRDIAPLQAALDFMLDRIRTFAVDKPGGD